MSTIATNNFFLSLAEAEGTLMGGNIFKQKSLDDIVVEYGDAASFALVLLGQVYMQTERKTKAVDAFYHALKLNPFLWSAFELLCRLGERPNAEAMFQLDNLDSFSHCHGTNPITSLVNAQSNHIQQDGGSNKLQQLEPMSVDHSYTPTPQLHAVVSEAVNTRSEKYVHAIIMYLILLIIIFTLFSTPLPCVPLIHHNIPNLTPDDQMIPTGPFISTMAPRSKPRSFRLRSVFNAGQALSPMSPK